MASTEVIYITTSGQTPALSGTRLLRPVLLFKGTSGTGSITGTVRRQVTLTTTAPLARRVRLYRDSDGALIGQTMSDAVTGVYTFTGIDKGQAYTALAYDNVHNYRAVAADNLLPQ